MTKKKTLIPILILVAVLLVTVIYFSQPARIDWFMYGAFMDGDGEVIENITYSVKGKITKSKDTPSNYYSLHIEGIFPDSFRFDLPVTEPGYVGYRLEVSGKELYLCSGFSFDFTEKHATPCQFILIPSDEIMLIYWREENLYLAASSSPDFDPAQILSLYINEFC